VGAGQPAEATDDGEGRQIDRAILRRAGLASIARTFPICPNRSLKCSFSRRWAAVWRSLPSVLP